MNEKCASEERKSRGRENSIIFSLENLRNAYLNRTAGPPPIPKMTSASSMLLVQRFVEKHPPQREKLLAKDSRAANQTRLIGILGGMLVAFEIIVAVLLGLIIKSNFISPPNANQAPQEIALAHQKIIPTSPTSVSASTQVSGPNIRSAEQPATSNEHAVIPNDNTSSAVKRSAPRKIALSRRPVRTRKVAIRQTSNTQKTALSSNSHSDPLTRHIDQLLGASPDIETPRAQVLDSLDKDTIQKAMRQHKFSVQACYEKYNVPGTVAVRLVVDPSGKVSAVNINGSFNDTPTGACVAAALSRVTFPRFNGSPVTIRYPFLLRSTPSVVADNSISATENNI